MDSESTFTATAHAREKRSPIEVLPRDEAREHLLAISDILAKVLDTSIRIPGTSWSIGLDPLLGLLPGIGDVIANLIGTVILGIATRLHIPRIVLARMSLNLLINGTVGAVPSQSGSGVMREMPRCFARQL